ncbi:MAG: RNA methyltransferase [Rhodoferax sp.]|uniref:RNA methyltransferase n=1 Tax=Rhodoferax sp. TaxID=50421 RepID=UPI0030187D93
MQTRFILINTSHAGNVGAAARAMKTMGFTDLVLVAPRWANVLNREETIQRASGALDVLKNARIVGTLDEALEGMTHLCATAMTPRDFGPPTVTPREHFEVLSKKELLTKAARGLEADLANNSEDGAALGAEVAVQQGVAFLFGCERFGMSNEDVYRCHVALNIPSDPKFGSLNLAAAIQVVAYEWRLALGGFAAPASAPPALLEEAQAPTGHARFDVLADASQMAGMLAHWERALISIGFLDPQAPKKLMPRLNQLFNRAGLTQGEIHILRGIAKMMDQTAAPEKSLAPAATPSKG